VSLKPRQRGISSCGTECPALSFRTSPAPRRKGVVASKVVLVGCPSDLGLVRRLGNLGGGHIFRAPGLAQRAASTTRCAIAHYIS
jgi:hypothetical protein